MDLPTRLNLNDSILKAAQAILDKGKEEKPVVKEETLTELRQTVTTTDATPSDTVERVRARLRAPTIINRSLSLARRAVTSGVGAVVGFGLDSSSTNDGEREELDRINSLSPEDRARELDAPDPRIPSNIQQRTDAPRNDTPSNDGPAAQAEPQAEPQSRTEPQRTQSNDGPTAELPPITVTAERPARAAPRPARSPADDSSDRLNAISLGQSVADRGGEPAADAAPRNSGEEDAANNMRRRRREIASEEVIHPRTRKKKLVNPQIDFNPDTKDVKEAVVTKGRIASSKRITKALQDIVAKGEAKEYKFEDGTSVKIEPAMARIALNKYNAKSDFEKAQAAKVMRNSYKEFLTSVR